MIGFIIGAILYFAIRESEQLNRPSVKPFLISLSCAIIVLSPLIGPLSNKTKERLSTQDIITRNYPLRVEFTIESTTYRPIEKRIELPRAGYYKFDVYDKHVWNQSANTHMYPLLFDFGDFSLTTDKIGIFDEPFYLDKPRLLTIRYTSAYVQNLKAHLRVRELTEKPKKFRILHSSASPPRKSNNYSSETNVNKSTDMATLKQKDDVDNKETKKDSPASDPITEPEPTTFSIKINSAPVGAIVFIDKKKVGETPLTIALEKGAYGIAVEKDGYKSKYDIIKVEKGSQNEIQYTLEME
jgi:hypothetical protein